MTTLRTAARQALEALERYQVKRQDFDRFADEITALRSVLTQQAEPVAWMDIDSDGNRLSVRQWSDGNRDEVPLYTAPPRCPNCASLEAQNDELDRKLAELEQADLSRCPQCGGIADNGHDRSIPPNPYFCSKCMDEPVAGIIEPQIKGDSHQTLDDVMRLPRAMAQAYESGYKAGVAHEREACAKLAESTVCDTHLPTGVRIYGTRAADAIRARGAAEIGRQMP